MIIFKQHALDIMLINFPGGHKDLLIIFTCCTGKFEIMVNR